MAAGLMLLRRPRALRPSSKAVPTGKLAHWITLSSEGPGAYITNEGDNNVVTVDLTTQRVVDTIAIGNAPRKMVLQP